jgi:soluble lytic murein transglycosylase-like protein
MITPRKHLGSAPTPPASVASLLDQAATQYNVPASVLYGVAAQESGFNQNAVSPAGAIGVMQLMPSTAAGLGVDPNNIQQNIDGGAQYLSQLFQQFGSWVLALAAYNAGPGNVAKAGNTVPNFPETQNYVTSISAMEPQYAALLGVPSTLQPGNSSPSGAASAIPTVPVSTAALPSLSDESGDVGDSGDDSGTTEAGSFDPTTIIWVGIGAAVLFFGWQWLSGK